MTTFINANDPRAKRTRQLLLQAFITLLEEKHHIHAISVQKIAERATINRATFYAHFEDKYALVEVWLREKFQRTLARQLPASSNRQKESLHHLIVTVFDFWVLIHRYLKPSDRQFEPLFEIALQRELYVILLQWLKQIPSAISERVEAEEVTAQAISWAIIGPAAQWSRRDQTITKEVMAHHVLAVVIAGLSPIVTVT